MTPHDWRALSVEAITNHVVLLRGDLSRLRAAVRRGKEKNNAQLKALRADIARGLTVLRDVSH